MRRQEEVGRFQDKTQRARRPFAEHMRRFRRRYGVTQKELAKRWRMKFWIVAALERCEIEPHDWVPVMLDALEREYEFAERKELDELTGLS